MPETTVVSLADQLAAVPEETRPIVEAARAAVLSVAPQADEIAYRMSAPRSKSMMWKLARYASDGENVVGIGTFTHHAAMFFYRGRELDDPRGLLQGTGASSRFVSLRRAADAEAPAVRELLRQAFAR